MITVDNDIYQPKLQDLPFNTLKIGNWYNNLHYEISQAGYLEHDIVLLNDKNYYGKFLQKRSRRFFLHHFGNNLANTINYLFPQTKKNLRFLEIGCGCGNQLLLTSFLGAEVIGCDIRKDVCALINKRKEFYESKTKRTLNISCICSDVFKVDWENQGKFDAINFLFSFSFLRPNQRILQIVSELLKPGGRLVIQDFNVSNYFNRIFRRSDTKRSMTPNEIIDFLKERGFKIHSLRGGYVLPPIFCNILPKKVALSIEQCFCCAHQLSPSYHLMAEKL